MTACPQCGAMNDDAAKNCTACRVNLYWAFQHYEELAALRQENLLSPKPLSAPFLIDTSQRVDNGPTASWLHATIKKFGFKEARKKVCTIQE